MNKLSVLKLFEDLKVIANLFPATISIHICKAPIDSDVCLVYKC